MADQRTRDRIIEVLRQMQNRTVEKGCTPAEAAAFAAKCAQWIEKYQIDEAELRAKEGANPARDIEICENLLRTGKKVFNPGMTQVVNGLALGMCCKVILLHKHSDELGTEAVYGITGDSIDVDYVCQLATALVPSLQMMATLEGREHGYEKAGLVRWTNQYLTGAGAEIRNRIERERAERSDVKQAEALLSPPTNSPTTALTVITGESLALVKREATQKAFKEAYPNTKKTYSRSEYDHTANARGREAGKRVGLHLGLEEK